MLFAPIVLAGLAAAAAIPQNVVTVTQVVDCTVTLEVYSTAGGVASTVTRTGAVKTNGTPSILPIAKDTDSPEEIVSNEQNDDSVENNVNTKNRVFNVDSNIHVSYDGDGGKHVTSNVNSNKVDVSVNSGNEVIINGQRVEQREDPSNPDPAAPAVPAAAAAVPSVPTPPVAKVQKLQQPSNNVANQYVEDTQDQTGNQFEDPTGLKNKVPEIPVGGGNDKGKEDGPKEKGPKGGDAPEGTGLDCKQAGDGTVFDFQAGGNPLACEVTGDSRTEKWFAVSHLYPEWADKKAICGKEYIVTYKGKSCKGKLYDKCMGCKLGDIDLSFGMWNELTDEAYPDRFQMSWAPA